MGFITYSVLVSVVALCVVVNTISAAQFSDLNNLKCFISRGTREVQMETSSGLLDLRRKIYSKLHDILGQDHCFKLFNASDVITSASTNSIGSNGRTLIRTADGDYDLECLILQELHEIENLRNCKEDLKNNHAKNLSIKRLNQNRRSIAKRAATDLKSDEVKQKTLNGNEYNLENQINSQIYDITALEHMKTFLQTNPSQVAATLSQGENDVAHAEIKTTSGRFVLIHDITFRKSCVLEGDITTSLCVRFEGVATYTYEAPWTEDSTPLALVKTNTKSYGLNGVVNMSTACWKRHSKIGLCRGNFIPVPEVMNSPVLKYSVLSYDFWLYHKDEHIFQKNWVVTMSIEVFKGNVPSKWVHELRISSLMELRIMGNDWRRPQNLLSSLPSLQWLVLNDNNIEILDKGVFNNTPALRFIFLDNNNITNCPEGLQYLDDIVELSISSSAGNANLTFSDSDLDTLEKVKILWLGRTNLQTNVNKILKLPDIRCLNLSGSNLQEIKDDLSRGVTDLTLTECDLSYNMLHTLPTNIFSRFKLLTRLRLNDNSFTEYPAESLRNLTNLEYLDLTRNNISQLKSTCFSNLSTLSYLYLAYNNLHALEYGTFNVLGSLIELHLSHNAISVIDNRVFLPLTSLKILDLSFNNIRYEPIIGSAELDELILLNNRISKIENMTHMAKRIRSVQLSANNISELTLHHVRTLNLSYNSIQVISPKMWDSLDAVKILDLGGNNLKCCHNSTSLLQTRMNESRRHILNLNKENTLSCSLRETHQVVLVRTFVYSEELCDFALPSLWVQAGVPLGLLGAVTVIMMILLYAYRFEITYIGYLFKMKKKGKETDEKRYTKSSYDAFVCYSGKDFTWVVDDLLPQLENGAENYRLCLHDRDFTIGAAIDRNIVASIEKSRKVIIVLTKDFIGSKWCQWELEMANHKTFEEDRNYVIMIELERMERRNLPRHLRYLMDTRTYLEWPRPGEDERRFRRAWQRLRDALGDSLFQRRGTKPQPCTVLYS